MEAICKTVCTSTTWRLTDFIPADKSVHEVPVADIDFSGVWQSNVVGSLPAIDNDPCGFSMRVRKVPNNSEGVVITKHPWKAAACPATAGKRHLLGDSTRKQERSKGQHQKGKRVTIDNGLGEEDDEGGFDEAFSQSPPKKGPSDRAVIDGVIVTCNGAISSQLTGDAKCSNVWDTNGNTGVS